MEKLFDVYVRIIEAIDVKGVSKDINMISFDGTVEGQYFNGQVIGSGVDTQNCMKDGRAVLSARYMLEGIDADGQKCRIFVENNGTFEEGFTPSIVTDSILLSKYENVKLSATVKPTDEGVIVSVFA